MQHNYQPQQNEPNQIDLPVDDWRAANNRRREAHQKVFKRTSKLILCIILLNVISLWALLYYTYKESSSADQLRISFKKPLKFMSASLEALPIMEIQIVDYGSACPSDFEPLKLGTWPGTVAGCLCEDGKLLNSTCEKVNSPKCKKEIPSTYPIDIYEWEDSVWCIKRAVLGTDYVRQSECPQGYKACYSGGCFKRDCPITKLEISSIGSAANKFNNKEKYLVSAKIPGELPLINIQLTLGDIPCFSQDFSVELLGNFSYALSAIQEQGCDKYGLNSQFITRIDSQAANESFIQSSFPYFTMHLPHFEEMANSTISILSSMVRMKTARHDSCLNIDVKPMINSLYGWSGGFGPFFILFVFFIGVIQLVNLLWSIASACNPAHLQINVFAMKLLLKFNLIFYVPLMLSGFVWYFSAYRPFKTVKEESEKLDSLKCFEGSQGSLVISDYLESIKPFDDSLWTLFGIIFFGVSYILISVWYFKKKERIDRM